MLSDITEDFPEIKEIPVVNMSFKEITKSIEEHNRMASTEKMVEIIRKNVFESYYLNQFFN